VPPNEDPALAVVFVFSAPVSAVSSSKSPEYVTESAALSTRVSFSLLATADHEKQVTMSVHHNERLSPFDGAVSASKSFSYSSAIGREG
jgi:hypothetical protein